MNTEIIFRITEIVLQAILVVFAGMALYAWKGEVRGKDKYKLARALLEYAKDVRFIVHSKHGSLHQIYLNDILVDRSNFYNEQLTLIAGDPVYFDRSIWGLFSHINTRSDVFLPANIRALLDELCPRWGKRVGNKNNLTYMQLQGVEAPKIIGDDKEFDDDVYNMFEKTPSMKEYFEKWEKLIAALQKLT